MRGGSEDGGEDGGDGGGVLRELHGGEFGWMACFDFAILCSTSPDDVPFGTIQEPLG